MSERTVSNRHERRRKILTAGVFMGTMLATALVTASLTGIGGKKYWPGNQANKLTPENCGAWGPNRPEPVLSETPLLVIDDGRFNYPQDCNPASDSWTGLYTAPTQESKPATKVPDGTVLKVLGYSVRGQFVRDNSTDGNTTWLKVAVDEQTPDAWVPDVNAGWTSLAQLKEAKIPNLTDSTPSYSQG